MRFPLGFDLDLDSIWVDFFTEQIKRGEGKGVVVAKNINWCNAMAYEKGHWELFKDFDCILECMPIIIYLFQPVSARFSVELILYFQLLFSVPIN